jgi:hypothetical protein
MKLQNNFSLNLTFHTYWLMRGKIFHSQNNILREIWTKRSIYIEGFRLSRVWNCTKRNQLLGHFVTCSKGDSSINGVAFSGRL